ncbi:LIC_13387 family protein [Alteromonas macleodii]|uniref:Uncharacterized protein n=1 Tax=Alteromonas macleodii TaxID=28108 RepID=A0A6T9Y332_ALTMA|nr:hypothetical protein [Alteromonas macleodii]CAB9495190.1 conserved membrane protein of unknown function [Alteromonas macleodii]
METVLCILAALIIGSLGLIHLLYTLLGNKFAPADTLLKERMKDERLNITKETSCWLAWIGFNTSHSLGLLFFSAIYIYLILYDFDFVRNSIFLSLMPVFFTFIYLVLAKVYWFRIPFWGFMTSFILFTVSTLL